MDMRSGFIGICLGMALLAMGCGNDGSEYSGFSEMVADRHDVRRAVGEEGRNKRKNAPQNAEPGVRKGQVPASNSVSSGGNRNPFRKKSKARLYERRVLIMDAASKEVLARGVAHVNQDGDVVRLRVSKKK